MPAKLLGGHAGPYRVYALDGAGCVVRRVDCVGFGLFWLPTTTLPVNYSPHATWLNSAITTAHRSHPHLFLRLTAHISAVISACACTCSACVGLSAHIKRIAFIGSPPNARNYPQGNDADYIKQRDTRNASCVSHIYMMRTAFWLARKGMIAHASSTRTRCQIPPRNVRRRTFYELSHFPPPV